VILFNESLLEGPQSFIYYFTTFKVLKNKLS